jgi:hypothetical protein
VIIAALGAIVLPLISALSNPKGLVKSGLGVVAIVVIYFIAYAISGAEVTAEYAEHDVGPELSKAVGGTLIMAYILLGVSISGIFFTEISKIFK